MRAIIAAVLVLAGSTLCGCTSSQIPSWAMASADSEVHSKQPAANHEGRTRTQVGEVVHLDNTNTVSQASYANNESTSRNDGTNYTGSVPEKYKDLAINLRQLDRSQEDENRRVKAAITICRC
jgi:hypothetical protein